MEKLSRTSPHPPTPRGFGGRSPSPSPNGEGEVSFPPVSIGYAALRCRCPRCGQGKLYRGLLDIAEQCNTCGLALKPYEQGDGPAFFAILIIGALAAIGAAIMEIKYEPPFWLHAAIWLPFVVIGCLLSLRWLKAALVAVQYKVRS